MTQEQLTTGILQFCTHLFASLGLPEIKTSILPLSPLKVRVGVLVRPAVQEGEPAADPIDVETLRAVCTGAAMRDAWLSVWPHNIHGGCNPKSICASADPSFLLFDLTYYSIQLDVPDELKPL